MQLIELIDKINSLGSENPEKKLEKIKQLIQQYYWSSQYTFFQLQLRKQYKKQYPTMDKKGKPIEYTTQKYQTDDEGNIIEDENGNPIPNENYKPSFDEWLQNQTLQWNMEHFDNIDNNPYQFRFDPSKVIIDANIKAALKSFNKKLFIKYTQNYFIHSEAINARVNVGDEHLRNVEKLISYMETNNVSEVTFRTYDNAFVNVTLDQLKQLDEEFIQYGMQMYQKKWANEQLIDSIETFTDLMQLEINYDISPK